MRLFKPKERIVATVGLPGHGKTVFLASLFWDSFFALSESFRDGQQPYSVRALNAKSDDIFYGNAQMFFDLVLPPTNPPRKEPEPAILEFTGVPSANSRRRSIQLTFYDIAGEDFKSEGSVLKYASFVTRAHDLVFLFDPAQPDFNALSAARLVDRICNVAKGKRKKLRKNIVIALTKMDELRDHDEWWADTIREFWPDEVPSHSQLSRYLTQMETLSVMLRSWWTDEARQAHNLINSLPATTHFCAFSSLGHRPIQADDGSLRLTRKPEPFRVRDPLFWIFREAGVM